jgi:hypothetical protein
VRDFSSAALAGHLFLKAHIVSIVELWVMYRELSKQVYRQFGTFKGSQCHSDGISHESDSLVRSDPDSGKDRV